MPFHRSLPLCGHAYVTGAQYRRQDQIDDALHTVKCVTATTGTMIVGVVGLYIVKSALGIDLFEGPSILHAAIYAQIW